MNQRGPIALVRLGSLMQLTSGSSDVVVAMIDGPVADHPDLGVNVVGVGGADETNGGAHGTFVAGILAARRGTAAPAICPRCPLLVRPVFGTRSTPVSALPSATIDELVDAILDSAGRGAHLINLSVAVAQPSIRSEPALRSALDYAASRGCVVVAAAGNQGVLGSSSLTRHPWVIPVAAFGMTNRPLARSNLGATVGRRGVGGPGEQVRELGPWRWLRDGWRHKRGNRIRHRRNCSALGVVSAGVCCSGEDRCHPYWAASINCAPFVGRRGDAP